MKFILVVLLFLSITVVWSASIKPKDRNKLPYKVVCYLGSWSYYRPKGGSFSPEDINPHLCTHINYGFMKLSNNKITLFDPDLDDGDENWESGLNWGHGFLRRVDHLREYNPNLSHLVSIGGWNEGSDKYSAMVSSASNRKIFVKSVLDFLQKYDLDGLDLDWEYPSMQAAGEADRKPGRAQDKADYIELLKELHEAFEKHGFLLTAAVSAGKPTIERAYDIPNVNKYLDFINLMTYDFHGTWDGVTGFNAPLHYQQNATGMAKEFTVQYATEYWLEHGMDAKKIVLGLPLYGHSFHLDDASNHAVGAKATKPGDKGPMTEEAGMLGYNEYCKMLKSGQWTTQWSDQFSVPYAYKGNQWLSYDDKKSIDKKLDYLLQKKLGGAMVWSIDTDDFKGECGVKYPLMKTISKKLNNIDGPDEHIPISHYTTPHSGHKHTDDDGDEPTTKKPHGHHTKEPHTDGPHPGRTTSKPNNGSKFVCKSAGWFKDPTDETKFHECVQVNDHLKDYEFSCPEGSKFDEHLHICV